VPKFRLDWSKLNRPQQDFIESRARRLLYSSGFGGGKTTAAAIKAVVLQAANPRIPGMIAGPSVTSLESTLLESLRQLTKMDLPIRGRMKAISLDGETPIYIRTAEAWRFMDGVNIGWGVCDEIRHWTKRAHDTAMRRRRIPCPYPQMAMASTPEIGWMSDEYDSGKRGREVVFGTTYDNRHNLEEEYIPDIEASHSARMLKAVLGGQFIVMEGAVFEQFMPEADGPWVVDYDADRWKFTPGYIWIDPGYRRQSALWVRPDPTTPLRWVVHYEMQMNNQSVERLVGQINALNESRGWMIEHVWIDNSADAKDQATEINVMKVIKGIKRHGRIRYIVPPFDGISWGVERVNSMLGDPEIGQDPKIVFSRELFDDHTNRRHNDRSIIKALSGYRYPELKPGHPVYDVPLKDGEYDHAIDTLRYGSVGLVLTTHELRKQLRSAELNAQGAGYASV